MVACPMNQTACQASRGADLLQTGHVELQTPLICLPALLRNMCDLSTLKICSKFCVWVPLCEAVVQTFLQVGKHSQRFELVVVARNGLQHRAGEDRNA